MAKITVQQLISAVESALGWPYKSPGSNDQNGIDCSGLFVYAYRLYGLSIYHGSNTIYRSSCSAKGKISSVGTLRPGMAVFKWNAATPEKFRDNLGDFQHIGLVTSVNPLRIVHASSVSGCVTTDTKLGKWKYWGWLKDVEQPASQSIPTTATDLGSLPKASAPEQSQPAQADDGEPRVLISAPNGGKVNIRSGNGTSYRRISAVPSGTTLEYIAKAQNGWYAVKYGQQIGWVSGEYCHTDY